MGGIFFTMDSNKLDDGASDRIWHCFTKQHDNLTNIPKTASWDLFLKAQDTTPPELHSSNMFQDLRWAAMITDNRANFLERHS